MTKRKRRKFTAEQKAEAVRLIREVGSIVIQSISRVRFVRRARVCPTLSIGQAFVVAPVGNVASITASMALPPMVGMTLATRRS